MENDITEEIKTEKVNELVNDPDNNYLLIVFGGKYLPKYDYVVYLGKGKVILVSNGVREKLAAYLSKKIDPYPMGLLTAIKSTIGLCLDMGDCREIDVKSLYDSCDKLKELGYSELEYIKL